VKIIRLTAENVKRLKAVEITPDGTVQVITGRNAQGKTSVLDAIWLALGGGAAARGTAQPIRAGEDRAEVTLDLGDLVVTRRWLGEKTALTVTSADGAKYQSPQSVLDALVGRLSFDPLAFTRLAPREQIAALLELVHLDVDLGQLAADRQRLYDERTEIGRQLKAREGERAGLGQLEDAPDQEVSASDLIARIQAAQQAERQQDNDRERAANLTQQVEDLERQLRYVRAALADAEAAVAAHQPVTDVATLQEELTGLEDANRAVRRNTDRAHVAGLVQGLRDSYDERTAGIGAIDRAKATALAAAEFPVPGLGFDDAGVTYDGVPFSQASSAEQIRVSLAMAMSLNPQLRVIRIVDGSLLDADSLRLISDMAADRDYQVWIERVADGSGVGVVIEDGEVAA